MEALLPVDVVHGGGGAETSPELVLGVDLTDIPFTGGGLGGGRPGAAAGPVHRPATPSGRRSRKARMEEASGRAWGPEIGGDREGRRRGRMEEESGGGIEEKRLSGLGFRLRGMRPWLGLNGVEFGCARTGVQHSGSCFHVHVSTGNGSGRELWTHRR
jgi:hypothetical protein